MISIFDNASIFLIGTLFDLYLFILALRIILVAIRADYYNPISQFVIKLTQSVVGPLRKIIPNFKNIELASVVFFIGIAVIKFYLLCWLSQQIPHWFGVIILALSDGLKLFINILFYAILINVILSWIRPGQTPITAILHRITFPILRPFQRMIPPIGGIDISPIPALILLQLLMLIVVAPLTAFGINMAFQ